MAARTADLKANITSTFDGRGFKDAESSSRAMEREFAKLDVAAKKQAEAAERANQAQRDAMSSAGKMILGVSVAAAAGLALTVKSAMDWESAWAGVTKTVDGSSAQMNALEGDLRRMARSLPATHTEIAAVAEAAGQLGVEATNVAEFTKVMIDLGETTNLSADEAAMALAQLANIMGTSAADVSRLGSTVVALGNNSATTERDIVMMAQRMAGAAAIIKMSEADTLSLAAALASVGIEVEAGGTAISRVMTDIAKAVDGGGDELAAFAQVAGVSAEQFARSFRADPTDAIITFVEGLGRIDAAGGSVFGTLEDLGMSDVRVSRALLGMANSGDLLRESVELGNQAWEENIALVAEANQRYQTAESRMQIARNQINDAAIDIGGNLLPVVAGATEAVGSMAVAFGALSDTQQKWVTWLGAGATSIGLVGGAALITVPKIRDFKLALEALNGGTSRLGTVMGSTARVLTGPWGLAVAGAVLALGWWAKKQGEAKKMVDDHTAALDQQTGAITQQNRELAFNQLQQDGIIDKAQRVGVSLADLVDAAVDPTSEAFARLTERKAELDAQIDQFRADNNLAGLKALADANQEYWDVLNAVGIQQDAVADGQELLRLRQEAGVEPTDDAAAAQEGLAGALDETASEAQAAKDALDALEQALRDINTPTLDLSDAQIRWQETLRGVNEALETNGQNLDIATEKGAANQTFLNAMARDAMALADALLAESESEVKFRVSLEQSRAALAATAMQFGMSEADAWAYVNSVLAIPPTALTQVDAETGNALVALNGLLVEIDSADGTVTINGVATDAQATLGELLGNVDESDGTVTINGEKVPAEVTLAELLALIDGSQGVADILGDDKEGRQKLTAFVAAVNAASGNVTVDADTSSAQRAFDRFLAANRGRTITTGAYVRNGFAAPQADGSIVDFYGLGGVREDHVAQIAPAGAWRVWAEPETGGEAYIPLAQGKRARSEAILGDVAARFGMYVGRYAAGAVVPGRSGAAPSVAAYSGPSHLTVVDADGALIGTMRVIAADAAAEWVGV